MNKTKANNVQEPQSSSSDAIARVKAIGAYAKFKTSHPGYVLFMLVGDFYELFDADAELAGRVLGIERGTSIDPWGGSYESARIPFNSVEVHLRKMIAAGHKCALLDQLK